MLAVKVFASETSEGAWMVTPVMGAVYDPDDTKFFSSQDEAMEALSILGMAAMEHFQANMIIDVHVVDYRSHIGMLRVKEGVN